VLGALSPEGAEEPSPTENDRVLRRLIVATCTLALAAPLAAQDYEIPRYHSIFSINPLGIPFEIASIELESAFLPGVTLGGALNYVSPQDDPRFITGDVKARYYPGEVALDGFSIGMAAGFVQYSNRVWVQEVGEVGVERREKLTAPSLSVLVDYNFLLGAQRRFAIGAGVGAKRILSSREQRERVDIPRAYPFARFVVGLAF
jgi:hypothetical protein